MSKTILEESRRKFLARALPVGAIFCLGCKGLMASPFIPEGSLTPSDKPKSLEDIGMSAEDVYRFMYVYLLPILETMGKELGRARLLDFLAKAGADNYRQLVTTLAKDYPTRDARAVAKLIGDYIMSAPIYQKAFPFEVLELTDKVFEVKYTQCLPAKILREMNAADIGYAYECSPGDALAKAINPKMRVINPKNLMKGDSVCIERYVLEV